MVESSNNEEHLVTLDIPLDTFRIFGFLDNTGFRTTAPDIAARRRLGFEDGVQRAFYSGYFATHGIKMQVITLPNGIIGTDFLGSLRVSDSELLNMSNLNEHFVTKMAHSCLRSHFMNLMVCAQSHYIP